MNKSFKKIDIAIGNELKKLRESKGMSMQYVADRCDCSKGSISLYENGKVSITVAQLIKMCDVYNIAYGDLLDKVSKSVYAK